MEFIDDKEIYTKEELENMGFFILDMIEPTDEILEAQHRDYPEFAGYITDEMGEAAELLKERYNTLIGKIYRSNYPDKELLRAWRLYVKKQKYDFRLNMLMTKEDRELQFRVYNSLKNKAIKEGIIHE